MSGKENMTPPVNGVIFDLEIVKIIPRKSEKKFPNFQYCTGWEDYLGMGISCICAYDMVERRPRVFTKGNFNDFLELCRNRQEIIGFNSEHFDDKVLRAHGLNITTTYDLLWMARLAVGEPDKYERGVSKGGFSLDQLCIDNDIKGKVSNGKDAPMWWQSGQHGKVIDYCLNDVMMTFQLFRKRRNMKIESYKKTVTLKEVKSLRDWAENQQRNESFAQREEW